MKTILTSAAIVLAFASTAFADGDVTKGEKDFKKCKSCHAIVDDSGEVIFKGGKVGPNLYGVIGRQAGIQEGFKYSPSLVAAGESGLVWTEELLAQFIQNPKAFLKEYTGDAKAKSKMSFKMKKPENVTAYLATFATPMEKMEGDMEATDAAETESSDDS